MRVAVCLFACLVVLASANTVPSFSEGEEFDLVMLAEQEAMGAIPAHMRLNPKVYESAEEARKAAENELKNLGEAVDTPALVTAKAVKEAMDFAVATVNDPYHSDMEGIKVDLGNSGDYAVVDEVQPAKKSGKVAAKPMPARDTQNEQIRAQASSNDVPVVKHLKKMPVAAATPKRELMPDGASHLLEDERGFTRPQAYPYGLNQMSQMPVMGQMPQMPFGQMFGQMGQMGQMPQMPQFPAMGQMGQMPFGQMFGQMPQMGQMGQMPQFGQMAESMFPLHNLLKSADALRAPDLECQGAECQSKATDAAKITAPSAQMPNMFFPGMMAMPQFPAAQNPTQAFGAMPAMPAQLADMIKQSWGFKA